MAYYKDTNEFYAIISMFFEQMRNEQPNPVDTLINQKIAFRFRVKHPDAVLIIDARKYPVNIHYGDGVQLKPELEIETDADTIHSILMSELSLTKAIGYRLLSVRGPVWKTIPLGEIFAQGKQVYPKVIKFIKDGGS
jgi:hypothetical protein